MRSVSIQEMKLRKKMVIVLMQMFPHKITERVLKKGLSNENNKKIHYIFISISIRKWNSFGYYSFLLRHKLFFDMLFDKFGIKLFFTIFWDYNKSTYKYHEYMGKAIAYHMNPIYCILISIAIITLSVLITIKCEKNL